MLLGAHCSGGVKRALDQAIEIGADALQLFAQSPRAWRFPEHAEEDLAGFRERRAEAGIGAVLIHALYLCNLATGDEVPHRNGTLQSPFLCNVSIATTTATDSTARSKATEWRRLIPSSRAASKARPKASPPIRASRRCRSSVPG